MPHRYFWRGLPAQVIDTRKGLRLEIGDWKISREVGMKEEEVRRDRNMVMFGKDRVRAAPAIVRVAPD